MSEYSRVMALWGWVFRRKARLGVGVIAFGLLFYAGWVLGSCMAAGHVTRFVRQQYIVAPQQITDDWLKKCLFRSSRVQVGKFSQGSLCFFAHHGKVMGFLNYDRQTGVISLVAGVKVKYNEYLYEIANYRNGTCDLQRMYYDDDREFLSLVMDLDAAAGVTAGQVEHFCQMFIRALAGFYTDFIAE